jgi:hypothetical protein
MRALWVTIFFATLVGCAHFRTSAGRVIIPVKWEPAPSEIVRCENAVSKKVSAEHRHLSDYYIRMYAVVRDNREVIVGYGGPKNGFGSEWYLAPVPPVDRRWPDEDPSVVLLPFTDGPDTPYFRFIFDRSDGKLRSFGFSCSM